MIERAEDLVEAVGVERQGTLRSAASGVTSLRYETSLQDAPRVLKAPITRGGFGKGIFKSLDSLPLLDFSRRLVRTKNFQSISGRDEFGKRNYSRVGGT
jgi:hypothetical protein